LAPAINQPGRQDAPFPSCLLKPFPPAVSAITQELVPAGDKSARKTSNSTLAKCSIDLTQRAREGKLDPCVGRDDEVSHRALLTRRPLPSVGTSNSNTADSSCKLDPCVGRDDEVRGRALASAMPEGTVSLIVGHAEWSILGVHHGKRWGAIALVAGEMRAVPARSRI
jgi:hypothetical protein